MPDNDDNAPCCPYCESDAGKGEDCPACQYYREFSELPDESDVYWECTYCEGISCKLYHGREPYEMPVTCSWVGGKLVNISKHLTLHCTR